MIFQFRVGFMLRQINFDLDHQIEYLLFMKNCILSFIMFLLLFHSPLLLIVNICPVLQLSYKFKFQNFRYRRVQRTKTQVLSASNSFELEKILKEQALYRLGNTQQSSAMLGFTTLCSTPEYSLRGSLLRPDLLTLQLSPQHSPMHPNLRQSYCIQMDDQYVRDVFGTAISGVKELFSFMINNDSFHIRIGAQMILEYTVDCPERVRVVIPLMSWLCQNQHPFAGNVKMESTCQERIEEKIADNIADKLVSCQQFKQQVMTRNQAKFCKLTEDFREARDLSESQSKEIQKLRKAQKDLREETKQLRQELKKCQTDLNSRQKTCENTKKLLDLEAQVDIMRKAYFAMQQEIAFSKQVEKGYMGRKMRPEPGTQCIKKEQKAVHTQVSQNLRNRQIHVKPKEQFFLQFNQSCCQFNEFSISGTSFKLKENLQSYDWKYMYLENIIPQSGRFLVQFNILKTNGNIAFGIVNQNFTQQPNCFNAESCIEYVGFSRQFFQGGIACLQAGRGLISGDQISFEVRPAEGVINLRNFSRSIAQFETCKLKRLNKQKQPIDKFVFFFRLKDSENVVQITSPMKILRTPKEDPITQK